MCHLAYGCTCISRLYISYVTDITARLLVLRTANTLQFKLALKSTLYNIDLTHKLSRFILSTSSQVSTLAMFVLLGTACHTVPRSVPY
jgi:hypothetical protein